MCRNRGWSRDSMYHIVVMHTPKHRHKKNNLPCVQMHRKDIFFLRRVLDL